MMANQPKPFVSLSLIGQAYPDKSKLAALTHFALDRDEIPHSEIEDSLRVISRRFERFPLKGRALYLYTNQRIHLLGNKETVQVPSFLPGWRVGSSRGVSAFVNAVPYVPAAGPDRMDVRKLFGLILVGQILIDTNEQWGRITNSLSLAKSSAAVYSRLMFKVVDRICGTGSDRMRSDQVKYVFAKYFLLNMLSMSATEGVEAIASDIAKTTAVPALLAFEAAMVPKSDDRIDMESGMSALLLSGSKEPPAPTGDDKPGTYSLGLIDFLQALKGADQWLARLTARGFLQTFVSMYNASALLAAEDAGYFFATLATHQAGADMVNSFAFDPVYGNEGPDVLVDFARLCD
jgi:hypothetical protein